MDEAPQSLSAGTGRSHPAPRDLTGYRTLPAALQCRRLALPAAEKHLSPDTGALLHPERGSDGGKCPLFWNFCGAVGSVAADATADSHRCEPLWRTRCSSVSRCAATSGETGGTPFGLEQFQFLSIFIRIAARSCGGARNFRSICQTR